MGADTPRRRRAVDRILAAFPKTRQISPSPLSFDRAGRLPKVSQLLPAALDQAGLPGIAKTIIEAIPARLVDNALPTAPVLRRTR